jgi:hypothetical protein
MVRKGRQSELSSLAHLKSKKMRKNILLTFSIFCFLGSFLSKSQNSIFSSGSNFNVLSYQVQVTIGEPLSSFVIPNPIIQDGILSVLIEIFLSNDLSKEPDVNVFPNPFVHDIEIQFKSRILMPLDAGIYTMSGELIHTFIISDSHLTIPLSFLRNGTYFIRIYGYGRRDTVFKILKL